MTAIQGLGIDIYYYVRCPSCGKVLASLENDYKRLVTLARQDIISKIPSGLPDERKQILYNELFETYYSLIMNKLGVTRICCMMRLKNPQQVSIPNPNVIPGNIAINRQNIGSEAGVRRATTRIELSKRSRVPGKSNINMMSVYGDEESGGVQEPWEIKMKQELDPGYFTERYSSEPPEQMMISPQIGRDLPTIQTGESRSLTVPKRPRIKNVIYTGGSGTRVMDIESPQITHFTELPTIEDPLKSDESNLMDLEKMSIFG